MSTNLWKVWSAFCGEVHLILGQRIDDLSDFMKYSRARRNGQSRKKPASRASLMYLRGVFGRNPDRLNKTKSIHFRGISIL